MEIVAFILFIVAAVMFLLSAFPGNPPSRWPNTNLMALGLCVLTVGFIVQFCANNANQVHF